MDSSLELNPAQSSKSTDIYTQNDQATEMEEEEEKETTDPTTKVSTGCNTCPIELEKRESVNIFSQTCLVEPDKIEIIVVDQPLSREDEHFLSQCNNVKFINIKPTEGQREEKSRLSSFSRDGLQINLEPVSVINMKSEDETCTMVEKTVTVLVHNNENRKGKNVQQPKINTFDSKKVQPTVSSAKDTQHTHSTIQNQKPGPNQIQIQNQTKNSTSLKKLDKQGPIVSTLKNTNDVSKFKSTREIFWRNGNNISNRSNNKNNNNNNNTSFNSFKNSKFIRNTNQFKSPEPTKSKPINKNNSINITNNTNTKTTANNNNLSNIYTSKPNQSNNNTNSSRPQSINIKNNITTNINPNTTTLNQGSTSIKNQKTVSKTSLNNKTIVQTLSNKNIANISLKSSNNSIPVSRTGSYMNGTKKPTNYFFSENQIDSKTGLLKPTESLSDAMSGVSKLESYQKFEISSRTGSKFKFPRVGASLTRPREIIHNHIVTKGTYSKTRWICGFETLTIKHCLYLIFPQNLLNSRDILTTLKFSSLTSFKNVVQVLRCCPNLIRLAFSNLSLVHKKPILPPDSDNILDEDYLIELPYLRELQFVEWISGLTKSEYWLLDFFFRAVTFGRLESFTFAGNENFMSEKDVQAAHKKLRDGSKAGNSNSSSSAATSSSIWRTTPDSYSTSCINLSMVWKFLQKNKSIEWLSLGGVGFYLVDPEKLDSASGIGAFNNGAGTCLQLTSLRITLNAPGVEYLLRSQRRLTTLSCSGFLSSFDSKLRTILTDCITNNSATLDTVRIFPCIITDVVTESGEERGDLYSINCESFQKCTRLQSLFLNTTAATQKFTKRMSCGHVLNIHLLPETLVQIEIYNEEFNPDELELLFGEKLLQFTSLKNIVLSSNSTNLYVVHLPWIQNLSQIKSFKTADFFGGRLEDPQAFRNFLEGLKNNDNSIDILMTICADCVCFSKFEDVTISNSKSNVNNQNPDQIQSQNQKATEKIK